MDPPTSINDSSKGILMDLSTKSVQTSENL